MKSVVCVYMLVVYVLFIGVYHTLKSVNIYIEVVVCVCFGVVGLCQS